MEKTHEIYLTKKFITKKEWLELINTISNYNGILRKWKISITNDRNQIRYFVKARCSLPTTINNLNSFLLKPTKEIKAPKHNYTLLSLPKVGSSIIDLINYSEIRNKGTLEYLEISFLKLYEDKIKSKIRFYLSKNGVIKKVHNGLYVTTDSMKNINATKYEIACKISDSAFLCYHSALEYYGLANQVFNELVVGSVTRFNQFEFENITYF